MLGTLIYALLYLFIHLCIKIGWWRWRVEGYENLPARDAGGMIVVMNHIHWIDILAAGALLPFRYRLSWLAKAELFSNPVFSWFFAIMNVIPVRRGKGDLMALDAAAEALRQGAVLMVFPEGHRSRTGQLKKGHGGAVRLAMTTGMSIVPLAITGTQAGIRGTFLRQRVLLRIGKPYRVEPAGEGKATSDTINRLTDGMMTSIADMLPEPYQGVYAQKS